MTQERPIIDARLTAHYNREPPKVRADVASASIIIPARYGSMRFPGKPLADLWGKPLVQHVYERAQRARLANQVIIATDDIRIAETGRSFGAEVALTRPDHPSGTDRVAEVARSIVADLIVNVQGDEPLIDPALIDAAIAPLLADPSLPMATACTAIRDPAELASPDVVKVVFDSRGLALYFSRLPIPFFRDHVSSLPRYRHVGIYAYRREFVLDLARLPPTPLEEAEKLEQLRVLEHGHRIAVVVVAEASPGVDTPADLERLRAMKPACGTAQETRP